MAVLVLGFLILLGLPRDSVSQPEERAISSVCGSDRVELYGSPEGLSFFVNEKRLEGSLLICEALGFYFGSGCFGGGSEADGWRRIGEEFCGRGLGSDFHLSLGRKVLRLETDASITKWLSTKGEEKRQEYNFSVKHPNMAITVPGMFLLCCSFICPCFRAKRKDPSEQHVLSKELNQTDLVSSIEVSSASVKVTATPPRGPPGTPPRAPPGTPPRAPPGTPSRVPPSPSRFSLSPQLNRIGSIHLSVNQIHKATQNFSPSLKLGGGGFGTVYKAELPGGQVVAIKRANKEHFSALRDEFSNEVELLAKIEHRNLVKLLGYTDKGNERIIITEYVPNGTLRDHLDGQYGKILDFHQRLEIAIDVAHGLTYLHLYAEKTIIHRDVKSSNILLTESYRAKVSDFGLARTGPTADQTHIMTRVKGTAGYLDPEYLKTFQLTPKSDVFSFGILLVEIISGRRPVDLRKHPDERITIRWAFNKFTEGNPKELLDPLLEEEVDGEVLSKILSLAFQCAAPTRSDRPTMKEVGEQLWEIRKEYGRSRSRV